jgi:hypothetical protein
MKTDTRPARYHGHQPLIAVIQTSLSEEKSAVALRQLIFEASIAESNYFRITGNTTGMSSEVADPVR